jgi:endogenous inhibitor of DNA gyrase (YacG/DUF329 family)
MKVEACHPSWPKTANFKCPHCDGLLVDATETDYYALVGQIDHEPDYDGPCPICGKGINVKSRTVTRYTAVASPASEPGKHE